MKTFTFSITAKLALLLAFECVCGGTFGDPGTTLLSGGSRHRAHRDIPEVRATAANNMNGNRGAIWSDRSIPVKISLDFAEEEILKIGEAFVDIEAGSCIKFETRANQTEYIAISHAGTCDSAVGRQGGRQFLFLTREICNNMDNGKGLVLHELLRALGFHHEHTRPDRDQFVDFKPENLHEDADPRKFKKSSFETFGLPYDYSSVTHFGRYDYGRDGLAVLVPKEEGAAVHMGQRKGLSELDKIKLQKLYDCEDKSFSTGGASVWGTSTGIQDNVIKGLHPVISTAIAAALVHKARGPLPSILKSLPPRPPKNETGPWNGFRRVFNKPRSASDFVGAIFAFCLIVCCAIIVYLICKCVRSRAS